MSFLKDDVIKYRLERARETYSEAEIMRDGKKVFATVNRLYYSVFYAISAYFVQHNLKAFTHAGLKRAMTLRRPPAGVVFVRLPLAGF